MVKNRLNYIMCNVKNRGLTKLAISDTANIG